MFGWLVKDKPRTGIVPLSIVCSVVIKVLLSYMITISLIDLQMARKQLLHFCIYCSVYIRLLNTDIASDPTKIQTGTNGSAKFHDHHGTVLGRLVGSAYQIIFLTN